MISISEISVRSLDVDYFYVTWKVNSTSEDLLDYTFQVLRSEGPGGPFEPISPEMEDRYSFLDNNVRRSHDFRTWFYMVRVREKSSGKHNNYGPADPGPDADLIATELRKHMNLLLREFIGRRCWVFPVRTFGQRCFLPGTVMQGPVVGASRALYKGKITQLTTKEGRRLTVTSNHPVLTSKGFAEAKTIRVGDQLVSYGGESGVSLSTLGSERYEYQEPARAEDVFRALSERTQAQTTRAVGHDFHGEAQRFVGDVEVVGSYRDLLVDYQSSLLQQPGELILKQASFEQTLRRSLGGLNFGRQANSSATRRLVGGAGLSLPCPCRHALPYSVTRFGLSSQADATLLECVTDGTPTNAQLVGQLFDRGTGLIAFDEVVEVLEHDYLGHVYDFQTTAGWIVASDILTSNCGCWNPTLQKRTRSHCATCFDTGFVRGYLTPIETWISIDPDSKNEQNFNVGPTTQSNTTARCGFFPPIKPRDLIVEPENLRWRVVSVTGTEQVRTPVHQELQIHKIPTSDIEYKLEFDPGDALQNLWLSPARNYTNPHSLDVFKDEEYPKVFQLYGSTYPKVKT